MGVPKFFRWVAERYPTVITPFKDSPPQVDNFYLDMNGIIHNCTHPNDFDAKARAPTDKEIAQAMFAYLERLFNAIQPRKYFLLAVDGVAPRAKMNQQRQRRYRSGYDMAVAREEALKRGEDLPDEGDVFDSNCITPGTDFMVRMTEHFHYFIKMKLATDTAWQNCKVIFSGHDHPGEGEHKIIEFIRGRKMAPDYDHNETHCMYGLDADLMMLALATHEPKFVLLREVVTFGSGDKSRKDRERRMEDEISGILSSKQYEKEDEFVLFHINVLRDYIHLDVIEPLQSQVKNRIGMLEYHNSPAAKIDFENVIDDFVFLCFFIGNDFLPSLPTVGINDGHMTTMLNLYQREVLGKGEYLTEKGGAGVHWNNVENFLRLLGLDELQVLRTRQHEDEEYHKRQQKSNPEHEIPLSTVPITSIGEYKNRFYGEKHGFENGWSPNSDDMTQLIKHYVEGLLWVQGYYYQGPPSWKWYFPHHYAPMASDLVLLANVASKVKFEKSTPFLPHQQLLAVLPPQSFRSMPSAYWPLLKSKSSPLARYFPDHLVIDKEGARAPWEGIVLIPFIPEEELLAAYESVQTRVTDVDKRNNTLGHPTLFEFNPKLEGFELTSTLFPAIPNCRVSGKLVNFPKYDYFVADLLPRVHRCEVEGWSSLRSKFGHIEPVYEKNKVRIFGQPSRRESLLLQFECTVKSARELVSILGKDIFVGFPHYKRARVVALSDCRERIVITRDNNGFMIGAETQRYKNKDEEVSFVTDCERHRNYLQAFMGVWIPEIRVLVHVQRLTGMSLNRKMHLTHKYASTETVYPFQVCLPIDNLEYVADPRYIERDISFNDDALNNLHVIYCGREPSGKPAAIQAPVMGSRGLMININSQPGKPDSYSVKLHVYVTRMTIPPSLVYYATSDNWVPLGELKNRLGIPVLVISHICSSMRTSPAFGSQELGLCIKFTGKALARLGFAKYVQEMRNPWYLGNPNIFSRMERDEADPMPGMAAEAKGRLREDRSANRSGTGQWYFSEKGVALITDYCRAFPSMVTYLREFNPNCNSLEPQKFVTVGKWKEDKVTASEAVKAITTFLQNWSYRGAAPIDVHKTEMLSCDEDAFPSEIVAELEEHLESLPPREARPLLIRSAPQRALIFPTIKNGGSTIPLSVTGGDEQRKVQIGARVVNCRTSGVVPFGAQGTITRMLGSGTSAEVVMDEAFTGGSKLKGRLKTTRGAIVKLNSLLVLQELGEPTPCATGTDHSPVPFIASPIAGAPAGSPAVITPVAMNDHGAELSGRTATTAARASSHLKGQPYTRKVLEDIATSIFDDIWRPQSDA